MCGTWLVNDMKEGGKLVLGFLDNGGRISVQGNLVGFQSKVTMGWQSKSWKLQVVLYAGQVR